MSNVEKVEAIRLLHLSDLHQGLSEQEWMWPTFKTQLYEDLRGLHGRTGPWDLVIFSGDLTQKGSVEEFRQLTQLLLELWGQFQALGSNPQLFVVPGNHDLVRPDEDDPAGRVMAKWWGESGIHSRFWDSLNSPYRMALSNWFANYENWLQELPKSIPVLSMTKGLLPGDVSATFEKGAQRLGLVGLNSAWLQHAGGDFHGRLCVHPRQLIEVTERDPDGWCRKHDFRLLVTHHPVDWLHANSQSEWAAEINTPGRFDAHLFGHMHEGRSSTNSTSGGAIRHSIQAASLFGLEYFGDNVRRDQGYLAIQIPAVQGRRGLRSWPRTVKPRGDGSRRLVADQLWELIEDSYCDLTIESSAAAMSTSEAAVSNPFTVVQGMQEVLARLVRTGSFNEAHAAVRKAEQTVFLAALKEQRHAWLVTSWGLGGDEFIECVQLQMLGRRGSVYYLDLHMYRTQEEVIEGLPQHIGCSFAGLCSGLAEVEPSILVLDDLELDLGGPAASNSSTIAQQMQGLVKVILDFCPDICVVVRSRATPAAASMKVIELKPLDEADTAMYVASHPKGGVHLAKHDAVMRLHRHTDGIPSRIDATLRDLHIVGLKGVYELDSDIAGKHVENRDVSPALIRTIKDLSSSKDETSTRSFALLKVLSMFPQGEQLSRVKRFFGSRAFHAPHASRLIELALVDTVDINTLGGPQTIHEQARALVVRRPVREYVIQSLSDGDFRTLSTKALSLYFGDDWELKGIRTPSDLRFKDARCEAREIANACTMILRATSSAIESRASPKIRAALALATSFAAQLRLGDHYRSIASLYEDLLPLHERAEIGQDLDLARLQYGVALRMIGEHTRSRDLLMQCETSVGSKVMRQQVLLNLALVSESLDIESAEIVEIAKRCEKIDPKTNSGLQAKGIVIANDEAHKANRDDQLRQLQDEAVRRKAFILSSNLAIDRAASTEDPVRKKALLHQASQTSRSENDAYNLARACLDLAELELQETGTLSPGRLKDCTRAYGYLYNQRMDSLFGRCHKVLWRKFKADGDAENMLTLFRHSSLVWRLKGQSKVERGCVEQLLPLLGQKVDGGLLNTDRQLVYFMTRSIQLSSSANRELADDGSDMPV